MKDRDCESCKKFSRVDPHESEGYCDAKRTWVDPQEGEDCKMHEFTLHSANKYKDGTPIYAEPSGLTIGALSDVLVKHTAKQKELSNQLDSLEQRVDELSEEYDTVLKTHGDTLEQHKNQIEDIHKEYDMIFEKHAGKINDHTDALLEHEHKLSTLSEDVSINEGNIESLCSDVEDLQRKVYQIYRFLNSVDPDFFAKVQDEMSHNGSNFCGNCIHCDLGKQGDDEVYVCELSAEIIDPDDSSCSLFEMPS